MARAVVSNAYGSGIVLTYGNAASLGFYSSNFVDTVYLGNGIFIDEYAASANGNLYFLAKLHDNGTDALGDDIILQSELNYLNTTLFSITGTNTRFKDFIKYGVEALFFGNDTISGNSYNDFIHGFSGKDLMNGQGGNDTVFGDGGNDNLGGGNGADRVYGGVGNDAIFGQRGNDRLFGGGGNDSFFFASGDGSDVVADFNTRGDHIVISSGANNFSQVKVRDSGRDTILTFGNVKVVLDNVDHNSISRSDFIFI
jgi:hypothetical protein